MLTTPAGRSLVAMISEKVNAGSGFVVEASAIDAFPAQNHRRNQRNEPEQRRFVRTNHDHDTGRFRSREIEMRARDRIYRAEDLTEFVRPARVMHEPVDRGGRLRRSRCCLRWPLARAIPLRSSRRRISSISAARYKIWPRK